MTKLELAKELIKKGVTAKRKIKDLEQYLVNKYTKGELEFILYYIEKGELKEFILLSQIIDMHDTNILYSDLLDTYRDDSETKNWSYDRIYKEELEILIWAYEDDGVIIVDDLGINIPKGDLKVDLKGDFTQKEINTDDPIIKEAVKYCKIGDSMQRKFYNRTLNILLKKEKPYTIKEWEFIIKNNHDYNSSFKHRWRFLDIYMNALLTVNGKLKEKIENLYNIGTYYHSIRPSLLDVETIKEYDRVRMEIINILEGEDHIMEIVRLRNGKHYLNDRNILVGITDGEIIGKDFYDSNNQHKYFKDLDIMEILELTILTDVRLSTENDMAKTIKNNGVELTNIESDKELNTNSKYITIAIPSIQRTGKDVDVRLINDTVYKFYNRPSTVRLESAQGYWKGDKEDITLVTYYNNSKFDITPRDIFQLKESFNQDAVSVWMHDNIDILEQLVII